MFDVSVRHVNDDEQLKSWRAHFITIPNSITSSEVPPLESEMINHRNMWTRIARSNKNKMISTINASI